MAENKPYMAKGGLEPRTFRSKPETAISEEKAPHFTEWKQVAIDKILADDELTKLLYYNVDDWKTQPSLTKDQKLSLIDNNIYQYGFVDQVATEKKSYLSIAMSHYKPFESFRYFPKNYMSGYLYFYILCERSILTTDYGVRADLIFKRLFDIFQGSRDFGIGQLRFQTLVELWTDRSSHGGYTAGFRVVDLND